MRLAPTRPAFNRLALTRLAMVLCLAAAVACGSTERTGPKPTPTAPTEPKPTPTAPTTFPPPPAVRVMTWNLQRGQAVAGRIDLADMAPFAARIAANRADVVGLQEVTLNQAAAVAALLGWGSPRFVETKNPCPGLAPPVPGGCVPFGNAIVSRHPLGESAHWSLPASGLEASVEQRVLLRSTVDTGALRLSVYVTHLASNATAAEREAQVRSILALVGDDARAAGEEFRPVLVGDFNAGPAADAIALVREQFVDTWAELGVNSGFTSNSSIALDRRIDYVFVGRTSGLRTSAVNVDPEVLSDHLAVVAELHDVGSPGAGGA